MAELERRLAGAAAQQAVAPKAGTGDLVVEPNGEPQWPDESAETAFLAQARSGEQLEPVLPAELSVPAVAAEASIEKEVLPKLEELLPKIPAEVMAALDEHFRAKFTGVRRVSKEALKSSAGSVS